MARHPGKVGILEIVRSGFSLTPETWQKTVPKWGWDGNKMNQQMVQRAQ